MPHSVIDIWQVLVTLPLSSCASKRFMAKENREQEGMQRKGDLSKETPLVGALVAMPVGSYCLFGKVVTDVGTCWLLGTFCALWHILDLVQIVRILQKTHKWTLQKPVSLWQAPSRVGRLQEQEALLCCLMRCVPAGCGAPAFQVSAKQKSSLGEGRGGEEQ